MIRHVTVPRIDAASAWRDAARGLLGAGIAPDQVTWGDSTTAPDLFGEVAETLVGGEITVPRSFVALANTVVWHSDPDRFARLYAFLWRVRDAPHLMTDRGDAELAKLRQLEKNVRRCQHKMKAFVRFREVGNPEASRRSFAAWFEPTHHTIEPTAQFFVRRFADMDWRIFTPDVSAIFEGEKLRFSLDHPRPDLPEDAGEALWITYFQNIFNPARLKVQAMQSEMPKKYWKNLPEAASIPQMIAEAPARALEMAKAAPTLPPTRMAKVQSQQTALTSTWTGSSDAFHVDLQACTRCALYETATQAVAGVGPLDADLMIVGEQPGDQEDLQGRPFVGPAGQLLDQATLAAGLDLTAAYVTNAVKHFKFKPIGRRRIHQRPSSLEISKCQWWLAAEIERVKPKLILAMGASAAEALTGSGRSIAARRGTIETSDEGHDVLITYHPAYLLRVPDPALRISARKEFEDDLRVAWQHHNA